MIFSHTIHMRSAFIVVRLFFVLLTLVVSASADNKSTQNPKIETPLPERALWRFEAEGCLPHTAAVDQNEIYLGTCNASFYRIDRANGRSAWKFSIPDSVVTSVHGIPALSDSLVFFGTDAEWENRTTGALYAVRRSDGTQKWKLDVGYGIASDLAQSRSYLFAVTLDDRLIAVSKLTGKIQWSKQSNWLYYKKLYYPILSSAIVVDSTVFFAARDSNVYALRVRDGSQVWKRKLGNEPLMRMARVGDHLLTGGYDSILTLLDMKTGDITATRQLEFRPLKRPLVTDSMIYLYLGDYHNEPTKVAAFTRDLSQHRWTAVTTDQIESPYFCSNQLSYLNGAVLAGSYDGKILAFDALDGEFLWDLNLNGPITLVQAVDSMVMGGNLTGQVTLQSPKRGIKIR